MKRLGQINPEEVKKVKALIEEIDKLDEKLENQLEELLKKEGRRFGFLEDPFEPYRSWSGKDYIYMRCTIDSQGKPMYLAIDQEGIVYLLQAEELYK